MFGVSRAAEYIVDQADSKFGILRSCQLGMLSVANTALSPLIEQSGNFFLFQFAEVRADLFVIFDIHDYKSCRWLQF